MFGDACGCQTLGKSLTAKDFSPSIIFKFMLVCPNTFEPLKMGETLFKNGHNT